MLVEFSVSNYRSIGSTLKLSMAASGAAAKRRGLTIKTENSLAPHVLKTAALFGPNGSGKSTLLDAFSYLQKLLRESRRGTLGDKIERPFNKLIKGGHEIPTELEIVFIQADELFQYGFSFDENRFLEEWLFARSSRPSARTRLIFSRTYDQLGGTYQWVLNDGQLPGERETWKNATRENALFLPTAVQLNSKTLDRPLNWIMNYCRPIASHIRFSEDFTAKLMSNKDNPNKKAEVLTLLGSLDIKLCDVRIETREERLPDNAEKVLHEDILKEMREQLAGKVAYDIFIIYNCHGELRELRLDEESDGTKAIFGMAGPILDVLENGYTLIVDEINNSLHPLALRALIGVFQNDDLNRNGAQLIFSSHETSILSKDMLHKEQIWFVDRRNGMETTLQSLSDFRIRDLDGFQRAYLGGKFGGVPNVSRPVFD